MSLQGTNQGKSATTMANTKATDEAKFPFLKYVGIVALSCAVFIGLAYGAVSYFTAKQDSIAKAIEAEYGVTVLEASFGLLEIERDGKTYRCKPLKVDEEPRLVGCVESAQFTRSAN